MDAFVRAGGTTPVYFVLVSEVAVSNKSRGMEGALLMKKKEEKEKGKKCVTLCWSQSETSPAKRRTTCL